ncbi:MAG: SDR family NAD(P)-dependent oxidoreductase [Patescibacteria group bacterium]|nr:SDR family NAD(P)-dependent oxidoreductase [Patescibacteria group bacterium]
MKKILITGGTGALGKELLEILSLKKRYEISFTYNSSKKEAGALGKKFSARPIQVVDLDIRKVPKNFDIVINAVGVGSFGGATHTVKDEMMRKAFEVNLMLPFKISKLVLPHMMKQNWGRIVNISSINGLRGYEYTVSYNVTKFALNGLTRTMAKEYAKYNITCNSICPAAIGRKGMAINAARFYSKNTEEFKREIINYEQSTPIGRMADLLEIVNTISFFISEEASYINGVCLPVDGGKLA